MNAGGADQKSQTCEVGMPWDESSNCFGILVEVRGDVPVRSVHSVHVPLFGYNLYQEASMRPIILFVILVCSSSVLFAQATQEKASAEKNQVAESRKGASSLSEEDVTALREDIARMRSILGQMETNLAFVDTTQSPLKHQFQLEIDMWKTAINEIERRIRPRTK
jgi:hypothetical protein